MDHTKTLSLSDLEPLDCTASFVETRRAHVARLAPVDRVGVAGRLGVMLCDSGTGLTL